MLSAASTTESFKRPMSDFEKCIKFRHLISIDPSDELIDREMTNAKYDLERAEESLNKGDLKWAAIQAYYSMYHSARILVLSKGYREKNHQCLLVALRELYVKKGELSKYVVENFQICLDIKAEADEGKLPGEGSVRMGIETAMNYLILAVQIAEY